MTAAKSATRTLSARARAQALISWLDGWRAAEKHYFKGKKPPGTMSQAIEAKILAELQGGSRSKRAAKPPKAS